jgi:integrase
MAPVKVLFATAVEEGVIRSNPAQGVRLPRRPVADVGEDEEEAEVKAMSEEQLRAVLAAILRRSPEWHLFFRFYAWSGLRIGEMIELRWRDVDLGARTVHVRRRFYNGRVGPPKSKYGRRRLRLPPDLARSLWAHRGAAGEDELVFRSLDTRRKGKPGVAGGRISPSNLMRRVLKPAAVEAGLGAWVPDAKDSRKLKADSWVGFHTFRHTCATVLFRRGWNVVQVQRWLGHHKPSFTLDTYVHLLDEDVPEPEFFDELAGAAAGPADRSGYQSGYQGEPKQAETSPSASPQPLAKIPPKRGFRPDTPRPAETLSANS